MQNDIDKIERVVGTSWDRARKNAKWVFSQNLSIQYEYVKEVTKIYHILKNRLDMNSITLNICANYIAAGRIRDKYTVGSAKKDIDIDKVPDTIKIRIKLHAKKTEKPVMRFLLERIDVVRQLVNNDYSYRDMKSFIDKTFPRKKLGISHSSIRTFVNRYILEDEEKKHDV
ncbi:hypothetical protein [Hydrogenimonas sp.]